MGRVMWILGEVVVGVLVGGLVSGIAVPFVAQTGWDAGPWVVWLGAAVGILAAVAAGEGLWKRRQRAHSA